LAAVVVVALLVTHLSVEAWVAVAVVHLAALGLLPFTLAEEINVGIRAVAEQTSQT
jgi:hypothetical protein